MSDLSLHDESTKSPFDSIRRYRADGSEYWLGRELMSLFGYPRWENFGSQESKKTSVIQRAITSTKASETYTESCFRYVSKPSPMPNGGMQHTEDCELTRYAAYIVAMCGDVTKPEIAMAQSYFATKAREAEVKIEVVAPASALPTRDTIDYINAQSLLNAMPNSRFKALADQMLIADMAQRQNSLAKSLPENVEIKHFTTAMIRASQLGYSVSQINGGAQLGKFVKQAITPDHQDWQGQYRVWQYEVNETLDARIHAYFLTRAL